MSDLVSRLTAILGFRDEGFSQGVGNATTQVGNLEEGTHGAASSSDDLSDSLGDTKVETDQLSESIGDLVTKYASWAAILAATGVVATKAIADLEIMHNSYSTLRALTRGNTEELAIYHRAIQSAPTRIFDNTAVASALVVAETLQLTAKEAVALIPVLRDMARIAGEDLAGAMHDVGAAAEAGLIRPLQRYGLFEKDFDAVSKRIFGARLDELDQLAKKQAIIQTIQENGARFAGEEERQLESLGGAWERFFNLITNRAGEAIDPVRKLGIELLNASAAQIEGGAGADFMAEHPDWFKDVKERDAARAKAAADNLEDSIAVLTDAEKKALEEQNALIEAERDRLAKIEAEKQKERDEKALADAKAAHKRHREEMRVLMGFATKDQFGDVTDRDKGEVAMEFLGIPPIFLLEEKEREFQAWYRGFAERLKLSMNPDDKLHFYDWRRAFLSGVTPDEEGHFPSEFKMAEHPNRFVDGVDTTEGKPIQRPLPRFDTTSDAERKEVEKLLEGGLGEIHVSEDAMDALKEMDEKHEEHVKHMLEVEQTAQDIRDEQLEHWKDKHQTTIGAIETATMGAFAATERAAEIVFNKQSKHYGSIAKIAEIAWKSILAGTLRSMGEIEARLAAQDFLAAASAAARAALFPGMAISSGALLASGAKHAAFAATLGVAAGMAQASADRAIEGAGPIDEPIDRLAPREKDQAGRRMFGTTLTRPVDQLTINQTVTFQGTNIIGDQPQSAMIELWEEYMLPLTQRALDEGRLT